MSVVDRFKPQEIKVARRLLQQLLDKPDEFLSHIRQYVRTPATLNQIDISFYAV